MKIKISSISNAVKLFKFDPIESLKTLLPIGMVMISTIIFIVEYTFFLSNGAYKEHMTALKNNGVEGIDILFETGFYNPFSIEISTLILKWILIAAIVFIVIAKAKAKGKGKGVFKPFLISGGISLIAIPLLLFLLKNIIMIGASIIVILVILVVISVAISMHSSEGEHTNGRGEFERDISSKKAGIQDNKKQNKTKEWNIDREAQLWVETTITGGKVIRAYGLTTPFSTEFNAPIYYGLIDEVSLNQFKKGEIIIRIKGKVMTERDLHHGKKY